MTQAPTEPALIEKMLDLHFKKGWSYLEIGLEIGKSRSAVAGHIRRNRPAGAQSPNKAKGVW